MRVVSLLPRVWRMLRPRSAAGSRLKVSMAPPRLLVEATPSEPAPDDRVTRATFSEVIERETDRPL